MTFKASKMKNLSSMTFQDFHDLFEPWLKAAATYRKKNTLRSMDSQCGLPLGLVNYVRFTFNGWQLAKMKKSIPDMSLP